MEMEEILYIYIVKMIISENSLLSKLRVDGLWSKAKVIKIKSDCIYMLRALLLFFKPKPNLYC